MDSISTSGSLPHGLGLGQSALWVSNGSQAVSTVAVAVMLYSISTPVQPTTLKV